MERPTLDAPRTRARAHPWRVTPRGAWTLLRPGNAVMSAVGVGVGALVAGGPGVFAAHPVAVAAGAVAAFTFTGAGNAANDVRDVAIDRVAHPERPLVTGAVGMRAGLALTLALYALSAAAALVVGPRALALVVGALVLMEAYERGLKARGLPGNAVVGALAGAPFVMGGLAARALPLTVLTLAGLAALATVGREVLKDVEDHAADAAGGRALTLPARIGARAAARVGAAFLVVAVLLSPVPFMQETLLGAGYLVAVAVADAGFLAAAVLAQRPARAQRLAKASMVLAMLAFVVGRLHAAASSATAG